MGRFLTRLLTVLAWTIALATFAVLGATVIAPKVMGWVPLTILSGSMEPTYPVGSQVIVERVEGEADTARLRVGDVITFLPEPANPRLVTHRIVEKSVRPDGTATFTTRGDANNVDDEWSLTATQIRGKVKYHVPWVGHVAKTLGQDQKNIGIWVVAAALFAYALRELAGIGRRRRRADDEAADGAGHDDSMDDDAWDEDAHAR